MVVGNDNPAQHNNHNVVDRQKAQEPGYCGFTFVTISTHHACTDCGKPAEGMLKKWDSGVLVWGRYACAKCSNKHVEQYAVQIST